MSDFDERSEPGFAFEKALRKKLEATGLWRTFEWGKGLLPPECREGLNQCYDLFRRPTLIRWTPDILAIREPFAMLIDAKTGRKDTGNYAIEVEAVDVALIFTNELNAPTCFVFDDYTVVLPQDVKQWGRYMRAASNGG